MNCKVRSDKSAQNKRAAVAPATAILAIRDTPPDTSFMQRAFAIACSFLQLVFLPLHFLRT